MSVDGGDQQGNRVHGAAMSHLRQAREFGGAPVLFAALSSVAAMFIVNGLPKVNPPIVHPDLTSHKFGLWVPETEPGYSPEKVEAFLKQLGAEETRRVAEF